MKIYYRCSKCHTERINDGTDDFEYCPECCDYVQTYKCQHNYWYELLLVTIKDFFKV